MALSERGGGTKGVDSAAASDLALTAALDLSERSGSVVCVSGETDYIVAGRDVTLIRNGHPLMPRVTGLGCTASVLCGAFAAVQGSFALAAAQAMAVMGIAGEIAAAQAAGPGSLQVAFLDALYRLAEADIAQRLRAEGRS